MTRRPTGVVVGILLIQQGCGALWAAEPTTTRVAAPPTILLPGQTQADLRSFLLTHVRRFVAPSDPNAWQAQAENLRQRILEEVILRGVPADWRERSANITWGQTLDGQDYTIRKLRYEVVPGLWAGALLYEPKNIQGKIPGVLNPNGHVGEPGMTIGYKQERCINLAKRGMIALSTEFIGQGQLHGPGYVHNEAAHLDLSGRAGVSVFYLALKRALDVLCAHPAVDPDRIAVTGLSGGGWQTILISALDPRIGLSAPNAGYINFEERIWNAEDIGDLEQNPTDLIGVADYVELTALLYPRPALLIYNQKDDCCFPSPRAIQAVYRPVRPMYEVMGLADRFAYHVNADPGTHNYLKDNREAFYRFLNRHFVDAVRQDEEIPVADEIRSAAELAVEYPERNADFYTLAREATAMLPSKTRPTDPEALGLWKRETRQRLREVVRPEAMMPVADSLPSPVGPLHEADGCRGIVRQLRVGGRWSLPAIEYAVSNARREGITVVLADKGLDGSREVVADAVHRLRRAVAVDLLLLGECRPTEGRIGQWAMMISAAGRRTLGIQVSQLKAVIEWLRKNHPTEPIEIAAVGRMAGLAALTTAALHPGCCDGVRVVGLESSLKELAKVPVRYDEAPSLFCFGLLEVVDVPDLIALAAPSRVEIADPATRPAVP